MRTVFLLLCALYLAGAARLDAQVSASVVSESDKSMSFGTRPCFSIGFVGTDPKLVDDVWAEFVRNNFSAKLKKGKNGEKTATGLQSVAVSNGTFTLYSKLEKIGDGAQLNVWFDLGAQYLSRRDDPTHANETREMLSRFYYDVRRAAVGEEVKAEETKLKDLETRQKKLQRENTNLLRDIENYKAKLKKAEEDLVQNQKDQETTIIDIGKQRQTVEATRQRQGNVENERQ